MRSPVWRGGVGSVLGGKTTSGNTAVGVDVIHRIIMVGNGGQFWSVLCRFCCTAAEATISCFGEGKTIFAALGSGFRALGLFGLPGEAVSSSRSLAKLRTTLTTR